jgi:hypothetical protein
MSTHKADTFGIAFGTRQLAEGIIGGLHDLAEHVGADVREGCVLKTWYLQDYVIEEMNVMANIRGIISLPEC